MTNDNNSCDDSDRDDVDRDDNHGESNCVLRMIQYTAPTINDHTSAAGKLTLCWSWSY